MATGPAFRSASRAGIVRFAAFEFDPATGELWKHGLRTKLQGQPIQVLALLVERAGEVVSREELQKRLWPADTYVDFEHSLNAAIKRLRAALGDSAGAPRYVETLPRQGYRFIAPLNSPTVPQSEKVQPAADAPQADAGKEKSISGAWRRPVLMVGAVVVAMVIIASFWLQRTEYFWRSPIIGARYQTVTDSDGVEQAAAVSRDGRFVAFLSDRDGPTDVWVTQVGSGQFHNLTRGTEPQLVNPSVRTLGFSPDASFVTFWIRKGGANGDISILAVPTLGGVPKPYLEGVAESNWSRGGSRLAYHTPGPGDPLFVSDGSRRTQDRPIFTAPPGLHSHFPLWSPDGAFIYFVQGSLPDKMDIWRIAPAGGRAERITNHSGPVSYPVFLNPRTLMYLAADPDGSGAELYSVDVERRIPHRLTSSLDRYTSLDASADGRRLVATRASTERTLWRLHLADSPTGASEVARVPLMTMTGFSPRLGSNYLLYVSAIGSNESVWKLTDGTRAELWSAPGAEIFGAPAISPDGQKIAFSVRQHGQTFLYLIQADGANAKILTDSLDLQGSPAWAPDGQSITSAANDHGIPRLFRVPIDGRPPVRFLQAYAVDPAWAPDGRLVIYSGPDVGTTFPVNAVSVDATEQPPAGMTLTRGSRHMTFLAKGRSLVFLRGDIQHKNLWIRELSTGAERQLTNIAPDFDIRDFDISPDGREVILERVRERSDVVLLDLP